MKRFLLIFLFTIVLPVFARADEVLVGQMCLGGCQHQHFDHGSGYDFTFTLNATAHADELSIEGVNFPGENDITDVELTGPGNIDLQWQLACSACQLDFHFDELFPVGDYLLQIHSAQGVFTVLIGDRFMENGCCGTMNGQQQAFVYRAPIVSTPRGLHLRSCMLRPWCECNPATKMATRVSNQAMNSFPDSECRR